VFAIRKWNVFRHTRSFTELSQAGRIQWKIGRFNTALYDAVVASAEHLKRNARLEKKVLLIVTDGEDSASHETLEQADASPSSDRLTRGALYIVHSQTSHFKALLV